MSKAAPQELLAPVDVSALQKVQNPPLPLGAQSVAVPAAAASPLVLSDVKRSLAFYEPGVSERLAAQEFAPGVPAAALANPKAVPQAIRALFPPSTTFRNTACSPPLFPSEPMAPSGTYSSFTEEQLVSSARLPLLGEAYARILQAFPTPRCRTEASTPAEGQAPLPRRGGVPGLDRINKAVMSPASVQLYFLLQFLFTRVPQLSLARLFGQHGPEADSFAKNLDALPGMQKEKAPGVYAQVQTPAGPICVPAGNYEYEVSLTREGGGVPEVLEAQDTPEQLEGLTPDRPDPPADLADPEIAVMPYFLQSSSKVVHGEQELDLPLFWLPALAMAVSCASLDPLELLLGGMCRMSYSRLSLGGAGLCSSLDVAMAGLGRAGELRRALLGDCPEEGEEECPEADSDDLPGSVRPSAGEECPHTLFFAEFPRFFAFLRDRFRAHFLARHGDRGVDPDVFDSLFEGLVGQEATWTRSVLLGVVDIVATREGAGTGAEAVRPPVTAEKAFVATREGSAGRPAAGELDASLDLDTAARGSKESGGARPAIPRISSSVQIQPELPGAGVGANAGAGPGADPFLGPPTGLRLPEKAFSASGRSSELAKPKAGGARTESAQLPGKGDGRGLGDMSARSIPDVSAIGKYSQKSVDGDSEHSGLGSARGRAGISRLSDIEPGVAPLSVLDGSIHGLSGSPGARRADTAPGAPLLRYTPIPTKIDTDRVLVKLFVPDDALAVVLSDELTPEEEEAVGLSGTSRLLTLFRRLEKDWPFEGYSIRDGTGPHPGGETGWAGDGTRTGEGTRASIRRASPAPVAPGPAGDGASAEVASRGDSVLSATSRRSGAASTRRGPSRNMFYSHKDIEEMQRQAELGRRRAEAWKKSSRYIAGKQFVVVRECEVPEPSLAVDTKSGSEAGLASSTQRAKSKKAMLLPPRLGSLPGSVAGKHRGLKDAELAALEEEPVYTEPGEDSDLYDDGDDCGLGYPPASPASCTGKPGCACSRCSREAARGGRPAAQPLAVPEMRCCVIRLSTLVRYCPALAVLQLGDYEEAFAEEVAGISAAREAQAADKAGKAKGRVASRGGARGEKAGTARPPQEERAADVPGDSLAQGEGGLAEPLPGPPEPPSPEAVRALRSLECVHPVACSLVSVEPSGAGQKTIKADPRQKAEKTPDRTGSKGAQSTAQAAGQSPLSAASLKASLALHCFPNAAVIGEKDKAFYPPVKKIAVTGASCPNLHLFELSLKMDVSRSLLEALREMNASERKGCSAACLQAFVPELYLAFRPRYFSLLQKSADVHAQLATGSGGVPLDNSDFLYLALYAFRRDGFDTREFVGSREVCFGLASEFGECIFQAILAAADALGAEETLRNEGGEGGDEVAEVGEGAAEPQPELAGSRHVTWDSPLNAVWGEREHLLADVDRRIPVEVKLLLQAAVQTKRDDGEVIAHQNGAEVSLECVESRGGFLLEAYGEQAAKRFEALPPKLAVLAGYQVEQAALRCMCSASEVSISPLAAIPEFALGHAALASGTTVVAPYDKMSVLAMYSVEVSGGAEMQEAEMEVEETAEEAGANRDAGASAARSPAGSPARAEQRNEAAPSSSPSGLPPGLPPGQAPTGSTHSTARSRPSTKHSYRSSNLNDSQTIPEDGEMGDSGESGYSSVVSDLPLETPVRLLPIFANGIPEGYDLHLSVLSGERGSGEELVYRKRVDVSSGPVDILLPRGASEGASSAQRVFVLLEGFATAPERAQAKAPAGIFSFPFSLAALSPSDVRIEQLACNSPTYELRAPIPVQSAPQRCAEISFTQPGVFLCAVSCVEQEAEPEAAEERQGGLPKSRGKSGQKTSQSPARRSPSRSPSRGAAREDLTQGQAQERPEAVAPSRERLGCREYPPVSLEVREKPVLPHYEAPDPKGKKQVAKPSAAAGAADTADAGGPSAPASIEEVLALDREEVAGVTRPILPTLRATVQPGRERLLMLDIPESQAVALSVYFQEGAKPAEIAGAAGTASAAGEQEETPASPIPTAPIEAPADAPQLCWSVRLVAAISGTSRAAPADKKEKDTTSQNTVRLAELDLSTWTLQRLCATLWSGERVLASDAAAQRRTHVPRPGATGDATACAGSASPATADASGVTGSALLQRVPAASCAPSDRLTAFLKTRGDDADQAKKAPARGKKEVAPQSTEPLEAAAAAMDAQLGGDLEQRMSSAASAVRDALISPAQPAAAAPAQKKAPPKKDAAPASLLGSWLQEGLSGRTGPSPAAEGRAEARGRSGSPPSPQREPAALRPAYFRVRLGGEERAADEV